MKLKKLQLTLATILFCTATTFANVQINETNFPCPNFRTWLLEQSWGSKGYITDAEIASVTQIFVNNENISDLTGINFFTNLQQLWCEGNQLTSLDVSGLINLRHLFCNNNQLTSLDVSGLINLQWLWCEGNQLISLDLTGLDNLSLFFGLGQTHTLTLTGSNSNYNLEIELNNPTNLALGLSYANGTFTSTSNTITSSPFRIETGNPNFALSGTLNLNYVTNILISEINFPCENFRTWLLAQSWGSKGYITDADIENITSVNVTNRNISDLTGIQFFTYIQHLYCDQNQLTFLDVSGLSNLQQLYCDRNQLTSLNVSGLTNLQILWCNSNQLTSLDVSDLTNLRTLYCQNNQLTSLDLTGLDRLSFFDGRIQTPALTLSGAVNNYNVDIKLNNPTRLVNGLSYSNETLTSISNRITSSPFTVETGKTGFTLSGTMTLSYVTKILINETNFPDANFRAWLLTQSWGSKGYITDAEIANIRTIDVSWRNISDLTGIKFFNNLQILYCNNNQLTSLDVSSLANLENLHCNFNQLTSLNISGLTNLETLNCRNNQLTSLDVSSLTSLEWLNCSFNQLTLLDVSGLTNLQELYCFNNQLASLDVSGLTNLEVLWCASNQLISLDLAGLNNLNSFEGGFQTPTLTLTGANDNYSLEIELNNPTELVRGLDYFNGVLTSTSNEITSSLFAVETGNPNFTLSGTLTLNYETETSIRQISANRQAVGFFTITGIKLHSEPQSGIFIILYDDGTSEKVMR